MTTSRCIIGDCLTVLPTLDADSFDACVTDPPYDLTSARPGGRSDATRGAVMKGFMGLAWDASGVAFRPETWEAVARVMKPGAHLLAFGGTRTHHRMMCAIEDAGWELRDVIMWVYGSGFPKSHNGEWGGTALKPAWEPIIVARKPLVGTVEENVGAHGTGALNIDGCRIETDEALREGSGGIPCRHNVDTPRRPGEPSGERRYTESGGTNFAATPGPRGGDAKGRWPANLIHDGSDEVVALFPAEAGACAPVRGTEPSRPAKNTYGEYARGADAFHGDAGSAARFFYCAKASRQDRNEGCESFDRKPLNWSSGTKSPGTFQAEGTDRTSPNNHPTVKPTDLMRYLCRLVTPQGGVILDPFGGSCSTGKAAILEGFNVVCIEREAEYAEIGRARMAWSERERYHATAQQGLVLV